VTRSPYNQYESIILPMRKYLEDRGVTFIENRLVTEFKFADTPYRDEIIVTGLVYEEVDNDHKIGEIEVSPEDLVFDTNGA
ncbi:oleate hydratase, partial [Clostridium tepidum]